MHVISYHDNSAGNRGANDPKNWAGSGHRTVDEMAFAHMSWYDLTEEEYNQEIRRSRGSGVIAGTLFDGMMPAV